MQENTDWLNETANKSNGSPPWLFFIIHETASPNPNNPAGTLNYNLSSSVGSSYHDLIGRDGVAYRYLNPDKYVAWHAGKYTRIWVDGQQFDGGQVNANGIGIEIDGKCDGTLATVVQLQCLAELLNFYGQKYSIPRDHEHLIFHSTACEPINPDYRSDARCTTIDEIIAYCSGSSASTPTDGYERVYRVRYDQVIVRQGPSRDFPEAGRLNTGDTFACDSIKWGEPINGDDGWLHLSSGQGFTSNTNCERI